MTSAHQAAADGPDTARRQVAASGGDRSGAGAATVIGAGRPPAPRSVGAMLALQRLAGNRAAANFMAPRVVQRKPEDVDPATAASTTEKIETAHRTKDVGDIKAIGNDNLHLASEDYRWEFIHALANQGWVGIRDEWALEKLWGLFGAEVFAKIKSRGKAASDDWTASIKGGADLHKLPAVAGIPDKFIEDVRQVAYGYLDSNDRYARQEAADLGKPMEAPLSPPREPNARLAELQKAAKLVKAAQAAQAALSKIQVGWEQAYDEDSTPPPVEQVDPAKSFPSMFRHDRKPWIPYKEPQPTFESVDGQWTSLQQVITGQQTKFPVLHAVMNHGEKGDLDTVATGNPEAARNLLAKSMLDLRTRIASTKPKVAGDLAWELLPIHGQLFAGVAKSKSGWDWSEPALKTLGEGAVDRHEKADMLKTLGLSTLTAAAFILAELGTLGAATPFLVAGGLGVSAGMAVQSWEKVYDLAQAKKTSTNPQNDLVESGQADSATVEAVLNTAMAFLDGFTAAKMALGAALGAGGRLLTSATQAGEASLRIIEGEVMQAAKTLVLKSELIEKSVTTLGVARTMELTNKDAMALYMIVGDKSPVALRLRDYALMPAELLKLSAEELGARLHMLPVEAKKSAADAGNLFHVAVEKLGPTKAVRYSGGWDVVVKAVGAESVGVQAVKAWRDRALQQLDSWLYSTVTADVLKAQGQSMDQLAKEFLASELKGTVEDLGIGSAKPLIEGLGEKDITALLQKVTDRRELAGTGLASKESMATLAKEGVAAKAGWDAMSVTDRGNKLLELANSRLKSVNVPEMIKFEPAEKGDGFFVWSRWVLQFHENILKDVSRFDWLMEAVQHESRHAEQVFTVARLKATEGMSVAKMMEPVESGGLAIPKEIAEAAKNAAPLQVTTAEGRRATEWFESMMGKMRPDRSKTLAALDHATDDLHFHSAKLEEAKALDVAKVPDKAEQVAQRERRLTEKWRDYDRAVKNYKALVEEADAYAVQAEFEDELRKYYQVLHDTGPITGR